MAITLRTGDIGFGTRFAHRLGLKRDVPQDVDDVVRDAVFLGRHAPEVVGDDVGGSNHVLPTARSARFSSGLSVLDVVERTSVLRLGPEPLRAPALAAIVPARAESLQAHARSVAIRLDG